MSGAGVDPEAIAEALAACFTPDVLGADVGAFPGAIPFAPRLGVFPGSPLIGEYNTTYSTGDGRLNFVLRTAITSGAEDALRALYRMVSQGAGHPESIPDVLSANRTLGGLVRDVFAAGEVSVEPGGEENAGVFIASVPVVVECKRKVT